MIAPTSTDQPDALDETQLRQICALVARGCTVKEAARCFGCGLSAIRHAREANDWFRRKLARAKSKANQSPLRAMQRAMAKDWRAAAWFLERTQPERFGRRSHRAFTNKQAGALIKDLTSIVGEEITSLRVFERISKRLEAAIRYALHAHNDTQRTAAELGRVMRHHDNKSPRYSPFLGPYPTITPHTQAPLASDASEFTRRGENLPPKPATTPTPFPTTNLGTLTTNRSTPTATNHPQTVSHPPRHTNQSTPQTIPLPKLSTPIGRTLSQQIVGAIDANPSLASGASSNLPPQPPTTTLTPNKPPQPPPTPTARGAGGTDCRPIVDPHRSD